MAGSVNNRYSGDLIQFKNLIKRLEEDEYNFRVEYSGRTRRVIHLDDNKNEVCRDNFFGIRGQSRFKGAHIVKEVKRELLKRIDLGEKRPQFMSDTSVVSFNKAQIKDVIDTNEGKCIAIDIKSCYWVTAYQLGVISKPLFDKYMSERQIWKQGMVASIGALNKKTATLEYSNGEISTHYMGIEFGKLRPYYWQIINRVNAVMNHLIDDLGDEFLMWLTDCVYVKEDSANVAIGILDFWNYDFTKMNAKMIKSPSPSQVWFKNDKKHLPTYINHSYLQDISNPLYKC
tara:strand:- start:6748 stop:7608 length:861 start_codon:yes stop_codon:yes gene_type:complete